jgi:hypothetical protein
MLTLPRAFNDFDAISGNVWNALADEVERTAHMQVCPPLELIDGPFGRRLALRVVPDRLYWGIIQCTGPMGSESDYADNRYWVALGYVSNIQTDPATAKVAVTAYAPSDPRWQVVTATNFFENNATARRFV